ncbi:MAG: glycosyltransferase family 4 protein [Anaerolineae bacterium]
MARILFLTQVLPYPLNAGPKVRAYHMLRRLAGRHQVTLVSFVRKDDTAEALQHLASFCATVHTVPMQRSLWRNVRAGLKGLATGQPILIARDEIGPMTQRLRQLVSASPYDVVHADQLSMAAYGILAAKAQRPRPKTLLDEHNAIYLLTERMARTERRLVRRLLLRREARAFARFEADMVRSYDAVLAVTEEDRQRLLDLLSEDERATAQDRITTVPICVDPDQTPVIPRVPRQTGEPPTIVHMGTMFWPPNVSGVLWFAREVLPRIHEHVADARFIIIGKSPPAEILALQRDERVTVTGYVEDPTPYLARADAFIVPLHAGGGMRVKILDAWLRGLPIVSTSIGAEGIEIRPGENILIADSAEAFAAQTVRLLVDESLNQRLRRSGREWVESQYAWSSVYRQVDEVYEKLLDHRSGHGILGASATT